MCISPIFVMSTIYKTIKTNKMNIQLKKVKINRTFSRETIQFFAELHINGKHIGYAENDGQGGSTNYYRDLSVSNESLVSMQMQTIKDAENYCKTLPSTFVGNIELTMDLQLYIDMIIDNIFNQKELEAFEKKKIKAMSKGLVITKSTNNNGFEVFQWKGHTIESLLKHPLGVDAIKKGIAKCISQGYTILNTNLPFNIA